MITSWSDTYTQEMKTLVYIGCMSTDTSGKLANRPLLTYNLLI